MILQWKKKNKYLKKSWVFFHWFFLMLNKIEQGQNSFYKSSRAAQATHKAKLQVSCPRTAGMTIFLTRGWVESCWDPHRKRLHESVGITLLLLPTCLPYDLTMFCVVQFIEPLCLRSKYRRKHEGKGNTHLSIHRGWKEIIAKQNMS